MSTNKFNGLTTDQLMNVILTIDNVYTAPQRVVDCRPGLGGLNHAYTIHIHWQPPNTCNITNVAVWLWCTIFTPSVWNVGYTFLWSICY